MSLYAYGIPSALASPVNGLLPEVFLEFIRRHPTNSRMGTDGIVVGFDIGENIRLCLCAGLVMLVMYELGFESAEEILGDGVVV